LEVPDIHAPDYFQWCYDDYLCIGFSADFRKVFKNTKEERILFSGRNAEANIISVSETGAHRK
jgi:hypothetical protein